MHVTEQQQSLRKNLLKDFRKYIIKYAIFTKMSKGSFTYEVQEIEFLSQNFHTKKFLLYGGVTQLQTPPP